MAQAPSVDRQAQGTSASSTQVDATNTQTEFASDSATERFMPYYTMFRNGGSGKEEFVILRPFVPFSTDDNRTELQAYMTASSDPDTYGQLISYVVKQDPLPAGPVRVADQAESEQDISRELSLQANVESGTKVKFGDLQLIPVSDGLVYIRPVYVVSSDVTEFRFVIVSNNNQSVLATSLETAFARLFPGFSANLGDRVIDGSDGGTDGGPDQPVVEPPVADDVEALLQQADEAFQKAQDFLKDGDLGAYQTELNRVGELITQARDAAAANAAANAGGG